MKKLITILFLLTSLGWTSAHAEYDPDSYLYGKIFAGVNRSDATSETEIDVSAGSGFGVGYTLRLTDWNLFGSIRYEHFNIAWNEPTASGDDAYLSHWGVTGEWRFSVGDYDPDHYFYAMLFYGSNTGEHWIDSDQHGTGFGAGYTFRVHDRMNIFLTARYEHTSQLLAGEPFGEDKEESYLDHAGVSLEWRY